MQSENSMQGRLENLHLGAGGEEETVGKEDWNLSSAVGSANVFRSFVVQLPTKQQKFFSLGPY